MKEGIPERKEETYDQMKPHERIRFLKNKLRELKSLSENNKKVWEVNKKELEKEQRKQRICLARMKEMGICSLKKINENIHISKRVEELNSLIENHKNNCKRHEKFRLMTEKKLEKVMKERKERIRLARHPQRTRLRNAERNRLL